jgi:hypothetical protein
LPKKGCVCSYVDLWPTDSEATFVKAGAKAIAESTSTSVDKVLETAKRFFGSLAPSVTMDEEGKPVLRFGISTHAKLGPALGSSVSGFKQHKCDALACRLRCLRYANSVTKYLLGGLIIPKKKRRPTAGTVAILQRRYFEAVIRKAIFGAGAPKYLD